jgi:RNA polymerase sporulation-specific sigma factor
MGRVELSAVKSGDKAAFEELLAAYEPLILSESASLVAKFPEFRSEEEEMRQEARLALYDAAMTYNESGKVTFGLYAKICIHNRLISYVRKLNSAKRRRARSPKNSEGAAQSSAETSVLELSRGSELDKLLSSVTSSYERRVFNMYLQKMSYADIAASLNKNEKSVANAICRVKQKLKKYLK